MESREFLPPDIVDNYFCILLTKHKKINKVLFVLAVASHYGINNSLVSEVR